MIGPARHIAAQFWGRRESTVLSVQKDLFKEAMSRLPSGVVIVTTASASGTPKGFTASSFTSVSIDPPRVLVCLALNAECHADFVAAERFAIGILRRENELAARRFASRGSDKFASHDSAFGKHGLPIIKDALATLICRNVEQYACGDHTIMIGEVQDLTLGTEGEALVYFQRRFHGVTGMPGFPRSGAPDWEAGARRSKGDVSHP